MIVLTWSILFQRLIDFGLGLLTGTILYRLFREERRPDGGAGPWAGPNPADGPFCRHLVKASEGGRMFVQYQPPCDFCRPRPEPLNPS